MPDPPVAKREPKELTIHGHTRVDDYFWLREREDPEVIAYLEAENAYTESMMAHTQTLQRKLFAEIKGRIKETDHSVPYRLDGFWYYARHEEGLSYPLYCRHKDGDGMEGETVMLDCNVLAEGHPFFAMMGQAISTDTNLLAYAIDTIGRRIATIRIKNLATGELLDDVIPNVTGNVCWANDNRTLFYTRQDDETLRPYRIYRHTLGTPSEKDVVVYEEEDETFGVHVYKSKSRRFVIIASHQTVSSEYRTIPADDPGADFQVFEARQREHEYDIVHFEDHFYICTNWDAINFRLMRCPVDDTRREVWEEVIAHRDDVLLRGIHVFREFMVLSERKEGLLHLRIRSWDGATDRYLDFGEPAYLAYAGANPEMDSAKLRYGYTSLTTPNSTYEYDMRTGERTLLKQDEVIGGFASSDYVTERIYATAEDGARVPVSLVYRHDTALDGSAPLLLYGYGSYGHSIDASFSSPRLSLLDRGFVFAIAHIRGGQELGRRWYDDGRLLNKRNTFTDFIACARHLIDANYTAAERLYASGGSAGGLLVGAVLNLAPELFHGAMANVPFVDVVSTMLDDDIPLTTSEYDEWGNPNEKEYYDYILSYSPYDNVEPKAYPHLLVEAGLHDSQVQYWEPAKWVAKLRRMKRGDAKLILKTNMDAGHGGPSGRYKRYEELAFEYAFLLDCAGIES